MEEIQVKTKFCKHCGEKIPEDAVICTHCGRQVEELKNVNVQPNVIINNSNENINTNTNVNKTTHIGNAKNKWVAFFLCLFFGFFGAHKFYEGKPGLGIVYLCTMGLFCIGWIADLITLFFKPNPYYV